MGMGTLGIRLLLTYPRDDLLLTHPPASWRPSLLFDRRLERVSAEVIYGNTTTNLFRLCWNILFTSHRVHYSSLYTVQSSRDGWEPFATGIYSTFYYKIYLTVSDQPTNCIGYTKTPSSKSIVKATISKSFIKSLWHLRHRQFCLYLAFD